MTSDPQPSASVQAFFDAPDRPRRSYLQMPLKQVRHLYEQELLWGGGTPEPLARVHNVNAAGVPARQYVPAEASDGVLVWLHGGGWNLGSVPSHDAVCTALANASRTTVLSVDYRLAPEHPFPAALDDTWTAIHWANDHHGAVAVGGDSAGGTLAAATAARARDSGLPIAIQLLVYPVLDYRVTHPTYHRFRFDYRRFGGVQEFGTEFHDTITDIWRQYIPDPARRLKPDASPLRVDSVAGLAAAHFVIAEHDILRTEEEEYALRLADAGVPVTVDFHPGQIHGFFPLLRIFPEARLAVDRCARALMHAFRAIRAETGQ